MIKTEPEYNKRLSERDVKNIAYLIEKKQSLRQIGRVFKITHVAVSYWVKKLGLKPSKPQVPCHCVICLIKTNLVDKEYYTLCKDCVKTLRK